MTDLAAPRMKAQAARYILAPVAPRMMVQVARHIPAPAAHVMRVQVGRAIQALVEQVKIAHQYADNTISTTTTRTPGPFLPVTLIPTKRAINRRIHTGGNYTWWQMPRLVRASIRLFIPAIVFFAATTAFALPGDPPLWGGKCGENAEMRLSDPDLPIPIAVVHKSISDEKSRLLRAKVSPYVEIDPKTGEEIVRAMHLPQVESALREVEEWERRTKDRAEKYIEVDPCNKGLIIRAKYVDLIW